MAASSNRSWFHRMKARVPRKDRSSLLLFSSYATAKRKFLWGCLLGIQVLCYVSMSVCKINASCVMIRLCQPLEIPHNVAIVMSTGEKNTGRHNLISPRACRRDLASDRVFAPEEEFSGACLLYHCLLAMPKERPCCCDLWYRTAMIQFQLCCISDFALGYGIYLWSHFFISCLELSSGFVGQHLFLILSYLRPIFFEKRFGRYLVAPAKKKLV